jgi:hypothetical protein
MRHRGRFLNQDVERGSGDQFATVSANLPSTTPANASPAQAAAQSNPHRRPTTHQPPRVLSSEAFGRRPPTRLYRSTTGRHPKPFTKPVVRPNSIEWVKPIPIEPFLFRGADEGTLTDNAVLSPLAVMRPDPACISLPTASERAMLPHQPAWWAMRVRENKPGFK